MSAVLMFGATDTDANLFHEIPAVIVDAFLYLEDGRGGRYAVIGPADAIHVRDFGIEVLEREPFGWDALVHAGADEYGIWASVAARACESLAIREAIVPPQFPIFLADVLRAGGVKLHIDAKLIAQRRRVKTVHELAGIRRAQACAEAALTVASELIRKCRDVEEIRGAIRRIHQEHDCYFDDALIAPGAQSASYHLLGQGPLTPGEPVVVDLWPRDRRSRCWADMTRTFVAGGGPPPAQLADMWRLCREALNASYSRIRAGVDGSDIYAAACEVFEAGGWLTQRTKPAGVPLVDGFAHGLGHGVGLEVHERPHLSRIGDELVAGDVIAIEPALYLQGFGGCRLEDLVLVTEDGYERLTDFPYELA